MAQHRRHPADGGQERRVGRLSARGKALAQGKQIEQQLDEDGGVAAEMPAVGQNLAFQLGCQQLLRLRELPVVAGDAQVGVDEADQGQEPGIAVGRVAPGGGEVGDLVGEAAHDGGVALVVGAIEQQARVRQPGDDAAANDLGRPGVRALPPAAPDPFADEQLRHGPGIGGLRGLEMAQPAEAVQSARPSGVGRLGRKRRASREVGDEAGEPEAAGGGLVGEGGIAPAQVGRRQQQLVGRRRAIAPAQQPRAAHARQRPAPRALHGKHGEADLLAGGAAGVGCGKRTRGAMQDRRGRNCHAARLARCHPRAKPAGERTLGMNCG